MLMELIEKKNEPIKTRYKFSRKEWGQLSKTLKRNLTEIRDVHFTARTVWFDVEGDKLNGRVNDEKNNNRSV